jgi:hypothetical protein
MAIVSARLRRGLRAVPVFLLTALPFVVLFYLTGLAHDWLQGHGGEIDAWLIAHFKLTKSGAIHSALGWLLWVVRYVLGTSLSLAAFTEAMTAGPRALSRLHWLAVGVAWRRLLVIAATLLALAWLPWQAAYWRPKALPATWVELAFAAVKLGAIYLLANIGWAIVLREGARNRNSTLT